MIDILKEINNGLKELNKSIKFMGWSKVKETLEMNLKNDAPIPLYQNPDAWYVPHI